MGIYKKGKNWYIDSPAGNGLQGYKNDYALFSFIAGICLGSNRQTG